MKGQILYGRAAESGGSYTEGSVTKDLESAEVNGQLALGRVQQGPQRDVEVE